MNDAKEKFLWLTLDVFFPKKKKCRIATFSKEFNNISFAPNKPILKKKIIPKECKPPKLLKRYLVPNKT